MGKSAFNQHRVHAFQIGQADELVDGCMVSDIPIEVWVAVTPLFCSHSEQGDIEYVGLGRIYEVGLLGSDFLRNEVPADCTGVDMVVDFSEFALGGPSDLRLHLWRLPISVETR